MKPPPLQIDRRRPVWGALSALFLDTELQPQDYSEIAHALAASGYSDDELEAILRFEVGPVLWLNLCSTAGVWEGFAEDWLTREIVQRCTGWRHRLPRYSGFGMVKSHWQKTRAQLAKERSQTASSCD